ncbi:MAG TPA: methylated-DNA--[protein]-cysteine S-methyltransferase [Burkholderiales bacterium]|nr:methylated-DNA--[protein]-cysteine S-methyltransferase [Burkholderiales bacterium]
MATRGGKVIGIRYLPLSTENIPSKNPLAERAARQLERYRDDPDTVFDLPLLIEGSPLQRGVWQAMCAIPRGRTRTYGDLARELGADARAIGQACGDNRLPIVIPCHRVVAADGIGGFSHTTEGYLIEVKRWLLAHEIRPEEFALKP